MRERVNPFELKISMVRAPVEQPYSDEYGTEGDIRTVCGLPRIGWWDYSVHGGAAEEDLCWRYFMWY